VKLVEGKIYKFEAASMDIMDRRAHTPENGTLVKLTQPHGCPKNGTNNHCFVEDAQSGEFIGLVSIQSLQES
jgi:hypothetical protein